MLEEWLLCGQAYSNLSYQQGSYKALLSRVDYQEENFMEEHYQWSHLKDSRGMVILNDKCPSWKLFL